MVQTINRQDLKERISARLTELKGGSGSGNFGHQGRPGEQGGSREGGEENITRLSGKEDAKYLKALSEDWYKRADNIVDSEKYQNLSPGKRRKLSTQLYLSTEIAKRTSITTDYFPDHYVFVLGDGKAIGTAEDLGKTYPQFKGIWRVEGIAVRPDLLKEVADEKSGYGGKILKTIEEAAKASGATTIRLVVATKPLETYYARRGYEPTGETTHGSTPREERPYYKKDLTKEIKGGPGSGRHPEVNSSSHDLTIEKSDRQWMTVHAKDKDGNRVGRLQLKPVGRNYQVNEVVVDKEHQGQGIASSLYQHAHDTLQSEGRKLYTSSIQTKDGERMLRAFAKRGWLGKEISLGQKQVRLISIPNKKSLPLEYLKSEYSYASTQINISDCLPDGQDIADQILGLGQQIDKKLLDDKGLEDTIHCTIKYGLHDEDPTELKELLSSYHGLNFTIGKLDVFNAEDTGTDYDVVILRVISSDLVGLNELITENLDNTETFKYTPHVTVAYVKAGAGQDIISNLENPVQNKTLRTDFILFSDKDGKMTRIPLGGTANMASKIDRATLSNNIRTRLNELQMEAKGGPGSGRHPEGRNSAPQSQRRDIRIGRSKGLHNLLEDFKDHASEVNEKLREGEKLNGDEKKFIARMDSVVNHGSREFNGTLYRGVDNPERYKVGETFQDKGFTSLANKSDMAEYYSMNYSSRSDEEKPTVLEISMNGGRVYNHPDLLGNEYILPRESQFKVISKEDTGRSIRIKMALVNSEKKSVLSISDDDLDEDINEIKGGPGSGRHKEEGMGSKIKIDVSDKRFSITHEGVIYHHTGKMGTDSKTGERAAEYASYDKEGKPTGQRIWVNESGKVST